MFKATATSTRCLSYNVQKASCIHSSSRLLHDAGGVPGATHGTQVIPEFPSKRATPRQSPRLPQKRSGKQPEEKLNSRSSRIQSVTKDELRTYNFKGTFDQRMIRQGPTFRRRTENLLTKTVFKSDVASEKAVRPAVQSARVKELSEKGEVEEAISLVYTAPRETLNTVVWNTLCYVLMRARRRKRAYEVYTEMKRRGFAPDAATYSTLLHGMAAIEVDEWPSNSENLERSHKLFDASEVYVRSRTEHDLRTDSYKSIHARTSYLQVLGKSGNFQKMIDLFYKTDETGPLARDKALYSVMFSSLLSRRETGKIGTLNVQQQNASDAKFFWRTLEKDVERGMEIDSFVIRPFLKLMSAGRPVDQQFGLEVVRDYFGLTAPGEEAPPPRLPMDDYSLHAILELCNKTKKFRLGTYFLKQIMDQMRLNLPTVSNLKIGSRHINEQLIALGQLAAVGSFDESARAVDSLRFLQRDAALEAMKPTQSGARAEDVSLQAETAKLALVVCWRCGDWESATEIFSLATGLLAEDFLDDGPIAKGSNEFKRPEKGRLLYLSAFSYLARTALSTEDKAKMRQVLRMMSFCGIEPGPFKTHLNFYKIELAKTTVKLVDAVSSDWSEAEKKTWKGMKRESLEVLSKRVNVERPEQEEDGLGSEKFINKLQQAIDFELAARSS